MSYNRLHLDFSLKTIEERKSFINEYLKGLAFTPTEEETEMIGDYLLWGLKDTDEDVRSFGLTTRWDSLEASKFESLDALIEDPLFNEGRLKTLGANKYIQKREVFSRAEARKKAPPQILEALELLWKDIDRLELEITIYELEKGKRTKEIRDALRSRFTNEEFEELRCAAAALDQRTYLKKRHLLRELRVEQYNYRDIYAPVRLSAETPQVEVAGGQLGVDIEVRPVGVKFRHQMYGKLFPKDGKWPRPEFTQEELKVLSEILWKRSDAKFWFDFGDEEHLYRLLLQFEELEKEAKFMEGEVESTLAAFTKTFNYYRRLANLDEMHDEILELKLKKETNFKISKIINEKYGKGYNENYISTIFKKQIIRQIAAAARLHREVCENLFFEENFKKCRTCGEVLLKDTRFFTKKSDSRDGFVGDCKCCNKKKKEGNRYDI